MLNHAYQNGYAIVAFDLVSLDFLEGIIKAAECCIKLWGSARRAKDIIAHCEA